MRKQREDVAGKAIRIRLWTHSRTMKAVPYLKAVVRSLRENWLEMRQARQQVKRLESRTNRADRQNLVLSEQVSRDADQAQKHFEESLTELLALDVFCLDPARGLALIPFAHGQALAWFVLDLFSPEGVETWRFHEDPPEVRRPLVELLDPSVAPILPAAAVDEIMSHVA